MLLTLEQGYCRLYRNIMQHYQEIVRSSNYYNKELLRGEQQSFTPSLFYGLII